MQLMITPGNRKPLVMVTYAVHKQQTPMRRVMIAVRSEIKL